MILTTPAGRRISIEAEVDARLGRVFYRVDKVGTFTMEHENSDVQGLPEGRLHVRYGRYTREHQTGYEMPEEPVRVYGVLLTGGWVFDPAEWLAPPRPGERWRRYGGVASRWLSPGCSESAPDGTRRRAVDIVLALAEDFLARPDSLALAHAGEVLRAPGRLMGERREIQRLREEIATREEQLRLAMLRADGFLALIPAVEDPAA